MEKPKLLVIVILVLLTIAIVAVFSLPNSQASENLAMVQIFEPDEAAPYYYLMKMISPSEGLKPALVKFVFYEYYYYGFPHFALSAVSLLPLKWSNQLENIPLVYLTLRQVISVLPMLLGILILAFLQDGFRTYRSIVLYLFLVTVPAVVHNNFWWHPDGLVMLFTSIILLLLYTDKLRFGWRFLLAAVVNGILIATKLVGAYFFLAVGLALIWGVVTRKIKIPKMVGLGLAYIGIMAASFVLANPFLLSNWGRTGWINTFNKQTDLLAQGYGVLYDKGLSAAWSIARDYYGWAIFILVVIAIVIWGIVKSPRRYLYALILAWFIPLTVSLIYFSHFKFQYWLPVALPLFSCIALVFPENFKRTEVNWRRFAIQLGLVLFVAAQFTAFIYNDVYAITARYHRAENNERIAFYSTAVQQVGAISSGDLRVYYDYRLYLPATDGWSVETTFELLDYNYIQSGNFDVLLLLEQRIRDYINPNVTGIDPEQFAKSLFFYQDAFAGTIEGYQLLYRDGVGLIFMKNELVSKKQADTRVSPYQ